MKHHEIQSIDQAKRYFGSKKSGNTWLSKQTYKYRLKREAKI